MILDDTFQPPAHLFLSPSANMSICSVTLAIRN